MRTCFIALFFVFGLANNSMSQTQHFNFWGRLSINQALHKNWKLELEGQYRTQNKPYNQSGNLFAQHLAQTVRVWVYGQIKPNLGIAISPFALFHAWSPVNTLADELKPGKNEYRLAANASFIHKFGQFEWSNRPGYELRIFDNGAGQAPTINHRFRHRLMLSYKLNDKLQISAFDEGFIAAARSNQQGLAWFDQNRLGLSTTYKPYPYFRLELGFFHVARGKAQATVLDQDINVFLNMALLLPSYKKAK
jgi:hypothetical protein